ncbi:MAG: hypothetical protein ACLQM8_15610 [Limisphaerales bacterium]
MTARYSCSWAAATLSDEFKRLDLQEQRRVWNELARAVTSADYGPLRDEELTAVADETFVLLDQEGAGVGR